MPVQPIITFTTDFGHRDGYVGTVKGVIAAICPESSIIDLSHEIDSYDIAAAAWILYASYRYFPRGSVHLAVVDPGVGSERKGIILHREDVSFVGPDNGIFSLVLSEHTDWKALEIDQPSYWLPDVSTTFHARDIFGPVAAWLAFGVHPGKLGSSVDASSLARLEGLDLVEATEARSGYVIYVDRFGNLISNMRLPEQHSIVGVRIGDKEDLKLSSTYSSVPRGELAALRGSHGHLEIALNGGSAAEALATGYGTPLTIFSARPNS